MNIIETKIKDLLIFEPRVFADERGWFMESFNQKNFEQALAERNLEIPNIVQGSPTFGQWVGIELTGENHRQFWIPAGFAHGFIALEDNTQFLYKTTDYYAKECERAIIWNDPTLAIDWPLNQVDKVLVSNKDQVAQHIRK